MPATVLEIGQKACVRLGLGKPGAFVGSSDETMLQVAEAIEQAAHYCWDRGVFEVGVGKVEHTTLAQENQGPIADIIPDLNYIMLDRALYQDTGGVAEIDADIIGGDLILSPAPGAGDIITLYYMTKCWGVSGSDASPLDNIVSDNDIILLDRELMILATVAQWRIMKRLSAEPDVAAREVRLSQLLMRDGIKKTLSQSKGSLENLYPNAQVNVIGTVQV